MNPIPEETRKMLDEVFGALESLLAPFPYGAGNATISKGLKALAHRETIMAEMNMGAVTSKGVLSREEDTQKTCPAPANTSGILYNENHLQGAIADELHEFSGNKATLARKIVERLKRHKYLRTTEPEVVDIDDMAMDVCFIGASLSRVTDILKKYLDAAGMKYK